MYVWDRDSYSSTSEWVNKIKIGMTFEELYEYAGGPVFITNQISQDYYSYKDATKYIMVGHYLTADGYIVTIFFENDIDAHIKEVIVECY